MERQAADLAPALYLVATPIGAARDITLRALDVLGSADILAAEDTRVLRRLLEIHGVPRAGRHILPYHDHNGPAQRPVLLEHLAAGRSVAYTSDAGTPLVADPGYRLVQEVIAAGHAVVPVPGASAVLPALTLSGLPSDRFLFAGFPPGSGAARLRFLAEFKDVPATLIFFESGKRVSGLLKDCVKVFGGERAAAMARELTKRHEEVQRGLLSELADQLDARVLKGEIVVLVDRPRRQADEEDVQAALADALATMSVRDAARSVADDLGLNRRTVYQVALSMDADTSDPD
ncbi:MAG: 16S rRNA (cytidine(1402)-2'-O)-methyltransferase [Pseudomonadota bacterium]